MVWKINFSEISSKQLKKLDPSIAKKIISYLKEKVGTAKDPRQLGKRLLHDKTGLWRFRVEQYRIICEIKDTEMTILVLRLVTEKRCMNSFES